MRARIPHIPELSQEQVAKIVRLLRSEPEGLENYIEALEGMIEAPNSNARSSTQTQM
jgi:hypothetical protein